MGSFSQ